MSKLEPETVKKNFHGPPTSTLEIDISIQIKFKVFMDQLPTGTLYERI